MKLLDGKYRVVCLLILGIACLAACKDSGETVAPVVVKTDPAYFTIKSSTANQLEVASKGAYQYEITTTGNDPYVSLDALTVSNPSDKLVLTFEYQSSKDLSTLQIFFGSPVTEDRSFKTETIPATNSWKTFSVDLGDYFTKFGWGAKGDYLRLDFGTESGVVISIRNIQTRVRNAAELALAKAREDQIAYDNLLESGLKKYFSVGYTAQVTEVKVGANTVTIRGNYSGEGIFYLADVAPYEQMVLLTQFNHAATLSSAGFSVDLERFTTRDGIRYDRALSRWAVVKKGASSEELISAGHYADELIATQNLPAEKPATKKGLGGYAADRGFQSDLDDLHITSATVNIAFTEFMYLQSRANAIAHTYGGKTYYFDQPRVEALDRTLKAAQAKNVVVAAIILVQKATHCADPEIGRLLQHPNYTSAGIYSMPNMTSPESFNCYAAALDFLATRYCRSDKAYGRIHHWILHNEVDCGLSWTNMGEKPMTVYMDIYMKSLRLCYCIARGYDAHSEVFASFTHSWAQSVGNQYYAVRDMLGILNASSRVEGDFQWGLACHPYPQNLFEPKTWLDADATFSMNSSLVTFKNLEVLDYWIKQSANKYKGITKRTLWLSENGTNSPTYGETDLKEQAAGFAYAWKKLKNLDGIDAIQWHNWIDNRMEDGLRIGLRRFPDDTTDPGGKKPVWYLYQAAGTSQEDALFDSYKSMIGVSNWSAIMHAIQ